MAVTIGSARSNENGKITGGVPGDQTGKEVATQNWYLHSKGWVLLRAKDSGAAVKIAKAMKAACANNKIGYNQSKRLTLYNGAKPLGFDCAKVTMACDTDCSALVRVCCAYAGITATDFTTDTQATRLMATGAFDKLTDSKYTTSSDYLKAGDILVTRTKGHTVVVLTDGSKAGQTVTTQTRPILRKGSKGADVAYAKGRLIAHGYTAGITAGNQEFGDNTDKLVRTFQRDKKLVIDGEIGKNTWAALDAIPVAKTYKMIVSGLTAAVATNLQNEIKRNGYTATIE